MSSDLIPLSSIKLTGSLTASDPAPSAAPSPLLDVLKATGLNPPLLVRLTQRQPQRAYELVFGLDIYESCIAARLEYVIVEVCSDLSNELIAQYRAADHARIGTPYFGGPVDDSVKSTIDPITEAQALQQHINERGIRASRLAREIGIARSTLSNKLRLLRLCEPVRQHLCTGRISAAQARLLVTLEPTQQLRAATAMLSDTSISVRDAWQISRRTKAQAPELHVSRKRRAREAVQLAERITEQVGYPVRLSNQQRGGELRIRYFDYQGLEAILERLNVVLED